MTENLVQPANLWKQLGSAQGEWGDEWFRTLLWRSLPAFHEQPPLVFVMLNPSSATGYIDDPTIRRCIGFAHRANAGGILVVNLCPYRSKDPKDIPHLTRRFDDRGHQLANRRALTFARKFGEFIFAWGANPPPILKPSIDHALELGGPYALCLGVTKNGNPRHPLYVPYDQPLVPFMNRRERIKKFAEDVKKRMNLP